jgi:SAM-dependent methyltransferase
LRDRVTHAINFTHGDDCISHVTTIMEQQNEQINALIELHRGLARQGPGDAAFSRHILSILPELPKSLRIADLGSGAGAGTIILAEWFNTTITAVDLSRAFLDELESNAKVQGLNHLVKTVEADMGNLDWPVAAIDLLWSEGAAYNLTFEGALKAWRPLLTLGGVAVISEMSWFTDEIPEPARKYWRDAYPTIGSEAENSERAKTAGFEVLGVHRLPSQAWWTNYYEPLQERMNSVRPLANSMMQSVIHETEVEIEIFQNYGDTYGYSFYILQAV